MADIGWGSAIHAYPGANGTVCLHANVGRKRIAVPIDPLRFCRWISAGNRTLLDVLTMLDRKDQQIHPTTNQ